MNSECNLLLSCGSTDCVTDGALIPNSMWGVVYYELLQSTILWRDETTIAIIPPELNRDATFSESRLPETEKEAASRLISGVLL